MAISRQADIKGTNILFCLFVPFEYVSPFLQDDLSLQGAEIKKAAGFLPTAKKSIEKIRRCLNHGGRSRAMVAPDAVPHGAAPR